MNLAKFILILGVFVMGTMAEKKTARKYRNITQLAKNVYLDTSKSREIESLDLIGIDAVEYTKKKILPTVLRFKQAIIEKNIDELMTFYSEEEFYPTAQDDYARSGVKTESMEEFKSVWKKDIEECKKNQQPKERLRDRDRTICMLFWVSEDLKTGEYIIQIQLETPLIAQNYHAQMKFTLVIYDKKREVMWVGIIFAQEGNEFKIMDNGGYDLLYIRNRYDPEHPPMPDM